MKSGNLQYPFFTFNTDRLDKPGTYCRSILDLHPNKAIFLFDSFGVRGLKNIIMQDDATLVYKTLLDLEKSKFTDDKQTLVRITLPTKNFDRFEQKKIQTKHYRQGFISFYCRICRTT